MVSNCLLLQTVLLTQCSYTYLLGHVCESCRNEDAPFQPKYVFLNVLQGVGFSASRPYQNLTSSDVHIFSDPTM